MPLVVALDGPAGAGKSTIAKGVSKKLGAIYVDTGAMYRATALYMLRNNVDTDDEKAVSEKLEGLDITIKFEDGAQVVILNGENVNGFIRTEEVGKAASKVSKYGPVRTKLVELQRKLAEKESVVMDGRDIGTVVLKDSKQKFYLTATAEERAMRRYLELREKGTSEGYEQVLEDVIKRDYNDSHRDVSPLRQAEDAVLIDSTNMTIDEVVNFIIDSVTSQ